METSAVVENAITPAKNVADLAITVYIKFISRGDSILYRKKLYDCPKMIYHYVCQYSYLYATELLCAFREEVNYLRGYPYYHIMSLGCGGCTDLMALEQFYKDIAGSVPISYIGIDVNELWKPVNNRIQKYCENISIKYKVRYHDVFKCFRQTEVVDTNVLVISYLISYLYNTRQISTIDTFVEDVVKYRPKEDKGEEIPLNNQ